MKAKVSHVRQIDEKKMSLVISGINHLSESEIKLVISKAFSKYEKDANSEDFKVGDKVMFTSEGEKNPFDHMRLAHGVEYCVITKIADHKFRAGGEGYTLSSPDGERFIIVASKKSLVHYNL